MSPNRSTLIVALFLTLAPQASTQNIWQEYRKRPQSELKAQLKSLGRDSLLRIAIQESIALYPDFDPSIFPYTRVYESKKGIHASFEMAIRFIAPQTQAYYSMHVNLTRRSFGKVPFGISSGASEPHFFVWNENSRKIVRWVLNLEETVVVDTLSYPDGMQVTITDQVDYYTVSRETRSGSFESYRMDKKTRKTSDHMHGDGGIGNLIDESEIQ